MGKPGDNFSLRVRRARRWHGGHSKARLLRSLYWPQVIPRVVLWWTQPERPTWRPQCSHRPRARSKTILRIATSGARRCATRWRDTPNRSAIAALESPAHRNRRRSTTTGVFHPPVAWKNTRRRGGLPPLRASRCAANHALQPCRQHAVSRPLAHVCPGRRGREPPQSCRPGLRESRATQKQLPPARSRRQQQPVVLSIPPAG